MSMEYVCDLMFVKQVLNSSSIRYIKCNIILFCRTDICFKFVVVVVAHTNGK